MNLTVIHPSSRAVHRASQLRQLAHRAADALHQRWPTTDVALFGSVARGAAHERSDIDLLITGLPVADVMSAWVVASDAAGTESLDLIRWEDCPDHLRQAMSDDLVRL